MSIVVIGSINMDIVARVRRAPGPGETIHGKDVAFFPGGKGANQAVAAARQGGEVAMVGRIGGDAFGADLRAGLEAAGVDASQVISDASAPTGTALIVVEDDGQNRIILTAGANGRVSRADVDSAGDLIARAGYVLLQFELPIETVTYAARAAKAAGAKVILNPAPAGPIPPDLASAVDFLVPNESEAAMLTGLAVGDSPSSGSAVPAVEAAARALLAQGFPTVVITLGAQGALLAGPGGIHHLPARPVTAVDTTAAGDAFIGAFAVALSRGFSHEEAVHYGIAAGTLAVLKPGAQSSLPAAQETERFYQSS